MNRAKYAPSTNSSFTERGIRETADATAAACRRFRSAEGGAAVVFERDHGADGIEWQQATGNAPLHAPARATNARHAACC